MRNLSFLILAFLLFNSFRVTESIRENAIDAYDLSCYRMKSKTVDHSDYNIWVVTNKASLEENFEADSCANTLDFEKSLVVALKLETVSATYKVNVTRVTTVENSVNVYFSTKKLQIPVEEGSPLEMTEISRNSNVKRINFYHGDMLVRTVPIVAVY